jgi:hypothetical protein
MTPRVPHAAQKPGTATGYYRMENLNIEQGNLRQVCDSVLDKDN